MKNEQIKAFDEETRPDHFYLCANDDCYFFIEYTARRPFNYSDANSFITNLKKKPSKRGTYEWAHKIRAIDDAAETLRRELPEDWLENSTFVPIPPSKATNDTEYDDRMSQVLNKLGNNVDVRELVYQKESMEATVGGGATGSTPTVPFLPPKLSLPRAATNTASRCNTPISVHASSNRASTARSQTAFTDSKSVSISLFRTSAPTRGAATDSAPACTRLHGWIGSR